MTMQGADLFCPQDFLAAGSITNDKMHLDVSYAINCKKIHLTHLIAFNSVCEVFSRVRLRFFDQIGYQTTNAPSGNKYFFTK